MGATIDLMLKGNSGAPFPRCIARSKTARIRPESNTVNNDFSKHAERALRAIEAELDRGDLDCDLQRQGPVLTLEFEHGGGKIIINEHTAAQEIWIAAKSGGFHFRWSEAGWFDTKSGEELFAALSRLITDQSGQSAKLTAPS
jgi:CyaY protein